MAKVEIVKPAGTQIKDFLDSKGTKYIWLANEVGLSQEHISNILADRVLLTDDVLERINTTLGTDFKK